MGTPPLERGTPGSTEDGPGRYTHTLYVDFRILARVRRCLEKIMRSFLWRGTQPEETRGAALVAWKIMCRPVSHGGLGKRNLLHTNMALLTKWVCRLMQPSDDLVSVVLRGVYRPLLD